MLKTCGLTIVLSALGTAGWAQTVSFSHADYVTSAAPRGIAAADFNRDGAIDLALANTGRKSVSVLINETGQGRGFVQRYDIVLGGGPFEVDASDVNHDGVVDLVVANADLNTIDIVPGRVDGGFEPPVHIPADGNPRGLAVADLDWDGHLDIVYTQFYKNSVQILHGDGAGNFTARLAALPTGAAPQGVAIGNFEHCCRPDIAVANSGGGSSLTLLRQVAVDTFERKDLPGQSPLNVLTTGDFNRDGRLDLAGVSTATNRMLLYRDMGSGFSSYGGFPTGSSPRGIDAADLNNDGYLDLVVANRAGNTVSVYMARPDPNGWFVAPVALAAGNGSRDVVLADFNVDGQIDIATANEYANTSTVLTNTLRPPSGTFWEARALPPSGTYNGFVEVADFNRNGSIDIVRGDSVLLDGTTSVPLSHGTTPHTVLDAAAGDYNGDGNADVAMVTIYHDGTYPQPITTELFYGDGAGGFQHAGRFGSFGFVYDVKAADLNNDRRTDLVIVDANDAGPGGRIYVLIAGGTGFVEPITARTTPQGVGLALGDVNRDGKIDVLAAQWYDAPGIQIYLGDGAGNLSNGEFLGTPGTRYTVHAVDINHDSVPDIVSGGDGGLIVWLGSASGTLGSPQTYRSEPSITFVADLTADGHLDVLTGASELLRGRGDGTFADPEPVNITISDAKPVDYDRDGRMDVVLVNYWHTMVLFSRATRGQNFPPVPDAGPDYSISYENQFGDFECEGNGASYDPNLDALTFEWVDETGRIVSTRGILCGPALSPGTHTFTLTVRDGHGGESSDTKTITVTPLKEVVILVGAGYDSHGAWQGAADASAAAGARVWHPDAGAAKIEPPLANPTHYVDTWFLADPSQNYKLWVRLKAQNNSWANDSVYVQFEGAAVANGPSRYAIGTSDALAVNLEQCSNCGVSGWGWRDDRWGSTLNAAPVLVRFPSGGYHRLRIQTREDGVSIDQIVLSSEKYVSAPPGPPKNDTTILEAKPW
jgi:hypothetical protein